MKKVKKRSFISSQHASRNVLDPTDNNSNIKTECLPIMIKQTHSFYKKFDDLGSRIAYLKSVKNLKNEFKRDSITIKKWCRTYLLPEFEIILDSLAFAIKVYECGCYQKIMKHKNLTKHHYIKLVKPFGILHYLYLHRKKRKL